MRRVDHLRVHHCLGVCAVTRTGKIARAILGCIGLAIVLLMLCAPAVKAQVRIPQVAVMYRLAIEREAVRNFGLDAPVARLAAQIHQESGWRSDAASAYAQGLTQFTPATAKWLPSVCPAVGAADPFDANWALRAQACYMAWLHGRVAAYRYAGAMTECTRWNYALRAYNGGEGMLARERLAAQRGGADANSWRAVEPYRARAGWAHTENVGYPRRILLVLEPAYIAAGWDGKAVCA